MHQSSSACAGDYTHDSNPRVLGCGDLITCIIIYIIVMIPVSNKYSCYNVLGVLLWVGC